MSDTNNTTNREKEIFNHSIELPTAEARAAYLKAACGSDEHLRQRMEALLSAYEAAGGFIPTKDGDETVHAHAPLAEGPGTRIGRYKLLQQIGEGGMGVVYMAEQEEPVRRRVALKVIKLGMDTRQVVARFEAERQALAMMDHPNIARVLDGGATESGRPYFVMELVQGVPITEYCDKAKLSSKDRLKLFMQVCQAIQSAHQKGIIHRDIKPSNVLITMHNGEPMPKVIDFGIAKATNQKLTEKTLFTNFASMIGTPAYMSPEQAELSSMDVDTRADIYSLGVLLYALLTGTTPFPEKRLRSLGYGEMQRVIREEEPERPSTRLSTMANEQKTIIARNHGEELASLSNLLKGDLDWVVMKCLEKDRNRRYETASGLVSDLKRHLENEPVTARPPSGSYRFQKMVRRNKGAFGAGVAIALTLIAALAFSTAAFVRERKARLAEAKAELARAAARNRAEAEGIRADNVSSFVTEYLKTVIPDLEQQGHFSAIRQLLVVADRLASRMTNASRAQAQVRLAVGTAYDGVLNDFRAAELQFSEVEKLGRILGDEGADLTLEARERITGAIMWGQQDSKAASNLTRIAEEAMQQKPPNAKVAVHALANSSLFHSYLGDMNQAEKLAEEALKIAPDDQAQLFSRMRAMLVLIRMKHARGRADESELVARQLLSILQAASLAESTQKREVLQTFVRVIASDGYVTALPEKSLADAINNLPASDTVTRTLLEAYLGAIVADSGDRNRGLNMLVGSITNSLIDVGLWHTAAQLAALKGDQELHRTLCIAALARFASGGSSQTSWQLAEPLLTVPTEKFFLTTVRELIEHAPETEGGRWNRIWAKFSEALIEYRSGRLEKAATVNANYMREHKELFGKASQKGWFLLSAIEARMDHPMKSREAYQEGLRLLESNSQPNKIPQASGDSTDLSGELLRREAAALLGDAVPATPQ